METKPRSPVFVAHDKFKELLAHRKVADDALIALMEHPRFWETGDGMHQLNRMRVRTRAALCEFVTEARKKYPMCHFLWNKPEFDQYELSEIEPPIVERNEP